MRAASRRRGGIPAPGAVGQRSGAAQDPYEERMWEIAEKVACPVCEGQSVKDSNAQLAREIRALIVERLRLGDDPDAIIQFLADRYGEGILMDPPKTGLGLGVWIGPFIFLAAGIGDGGLLAHAAPARSFAVLCARRRRAANGRASGARARAEMSAALLVILIAGFAASFGAMIAPLRRGRRQVDAEDREMTAQLGVDAEIQLAVDELSEVETEYADGYLAQDEYVSERRLSGARLRQLRRRKENRISMLERAIEARVGASEFGGVKSGRSSKAPIWRESNPDSPPLGRRKRPPRGEEC